MNNYFPVFSLACFLFPGIFFAGSSERYEWKKTALKTERIFASFNLAMVSKFHRVTIFIDGNYQSFNIPTAIQFLISIYTVSKSQTQKKIILANNKFFQFWKSKSIQFKINSFIEPKFLITTN